MEAAIPKVRHGRRERQPPSRVIRRTPYLRRRWRGDGLRRGRRGWRQGNPAGNGRAAAWCFGAPRALAARRRRGAGRLASSRKATSRRSWRRFSMPPAAADESEQVSGAGAGAGKAGHGAGERAAGSAGALTGPLDAIDPGARQPGRSATSRDGAKSAQCSARKDRALAFLASVIPVLTDYRHDAPE